MTDNYILFIFMGIIILVPIIPAYIFYKIIPNQETDVRGTFASVKFKLTGAFGGFFLLFFILLFSLKQELKPMATWQIWAVDGEVEFNKGAGTYETLVIEVTPPLYTNSENLFEIKILAEPDHAGQIDFPKITIQHEQYITVPINLTDKEKVEKYNMKKRFKIKDPIILIKAPKPDESDN